MTLAQSARRLAGQAELLLGWRPEDFWRATPDELDTALDALRVTMPGSDRRIDRDTFARLLEMHPDG